MEWGKRPLKSVRIYVLDRINYESEIESEIIEWLK